MQSKHFTFKTSLMTKTLPKVCMTTALILQASELSLTGPASHLQAHLTGNSGEDLRFRLSELPCPVIRTGKHSFTLGIMVGRHSG